jgi:hypothetical protein
MFDIQKKSTLLTQCVWEPRLKMLFPSLAHPSRENNVTLIISHKNAMRNPFDGAPNKTRIFVALVTGKLWSLHVFIRGSSLGRFLYDPSSVG